MSRIEKILNTFGLEPARAMKANSSGVPSPSWYRGGSIFDTPQVDDAVQSYEDLARRFTISDLQAG